MRWEDVMSTQEHKKKGPKNLIIGVITVSSTRTERNDKSGAWIMAEAKREGVEVVSYMIVPDDRTAIRNAVMDIVSGKVHAIILTGGTGIAEKDVTIETVQPLFDKEMTAFGPVFAQLSFEEINSAAILSRAAAGIIYTTCVFCMPGSIKACKLACREIIFPELAHIAGHIASG